MGKNTSRGKKKKEGIESLKNVAILSDLSEHELDYVLAITKKVEFPAGEVIMSEGETGSTMYFFVDGEVLVSKNLTLKIGKKDLDTQRSQWLN